MYVRESKHGPSVDRTQRVDGSVERVSSGDRYVNLRFGREPGEYLVVYVPKSCNIHRAGERLPLHDVQSLDNVAVWCHRHPDYGIPLAHELEVF
jgi:hypothetical protein